MPSKKPDSKNFRTIKRRKSGMSTRKTVRTKKHNKVLLWTAGNDPDDLEAITEDGKIPMDYKVMISILLNYFYGKCDTLLDNEVINPYKEYFTLNDLFINQIKHIQWLYKTLNLYPSASDYTDKELNIYRGFDSERYELLLENMPEIGDRYVTPTFLSTSLLKNTAKRFTKVDNGTIWKINIPKEKLGLFKYTNLSEKDIDVDNKSNTDEAEILLNMGTILRLDSIDEREKDKVLIPQNMDNPIELDMNNYKQYNFTFIGYDERINTNDILTEVTKCLEPRTKVYGKKKQTMIYRKNKNKRKSQKKRNVSI
jgi:hypothetical protein